MTPAQTFTQFLRRGRGAPAPLPVALRAGGLMMLYEDGALRQIRWGAVEVVRALYAAVRDADWLTVPHRVVAEHVDLWDGGFSLVSDREYEWHGLRLAARCEIRGAADGLTFAFDGEAQSDFLKNRIGLCVLHPARECAGRGCAVTAPNGAVTEARFPDLISPHQPFLNLRGLRWRPEPDCEAALEFTGEVFETEDQRNWADASFKTYSTPLALPFPVAVAAGERFSQSVTLRVTAAPPPPKASEDAAVVFAPTGAPPRPLPPLGLSLPPAPVPLSDNDVRALRALGLSHLRAELRLSDPAWPVVWERARGEAERLGLPLALALFFGTDAQAEASALGAALAQKPARVASALLLASGDKVTPDALAATVAPTLRAALPGALLGAGTDAFFAELNRRRPSAPGLDFLCFSANPQVHAEDDRTLVENLAALPDVTRSARALAGGRGVHVGPVTLKRRNNPDATGGAGKAAPAGGLPWNVDPRQMSLLGAVWTLGAVKHLAESGADSLTFFETAGPRGVVAGPEAPGPPDLFPAPPGSVYPLYFVLRELWDGGQWQVVPAASTDPLRVDGLTLGQGGRRKTLVANLTPQTQAARVVWGPAAARLRVLDEWAFRACCLRPALFGGGEAVTPDGEGTLALTLPPYAVAVLETAGRGEAE